MELLGIELNAQEFDFLMCEQSKGKELKVIDGQVVAVEHEATQQEIAQQEIAELKFWFDTYYTQHEQKYRRLYTLKQKCDNGADPYEKLVNLYAEAEINRKEIQRLEEQLNG